mmetsp:Transcript_13388/g.31293  ORF Transcript_13388/g.31293 Transcript_13388/m.31293 type:complete len:133 (+) Transcript_13388:1609-2007(+)
MSVAWHGMAWHDNRRLQESVWIGSHELFHSKQSLQECRKCCNIYMPYDHHQWYPKNHAVSFDHFVFDVTMNSDLFTKQHYHTIESTTMITNYLSYYADFSFVAVCGMDQAACMHACVYAGVYPCVCRTSMEH